MIGLKTLDFDAEFSAAQTVAVRLEHDRVTRIAACLLTVGIIAWSGSHYIAFVWGVLVLLNEAVEPAIARQLLQHKQFNMRSLAVYMGHLLIGSTIWAGVGLALWMTKDPPMMTLGAVLLLGTLVHVSLIYPISRLLITTVSAPLILAMVALAVLILTDNSFPVRDKTLVIFSVLVLLGYLVALIATNIETQEQMADLAEKNARQARQDELTELSNRRHFIEMVKGLLSGNDNFALAFIDLDRFKPLNDEHGHAIGDEALRAIAERLRQSNEVDFAARLGGDEFGALLWTDARPEKLSESLDELYSDVTGSIETSIGPVDLGASIGGVASGEAFDSHSKLMHAADIAMIRAKTTGGGVSVFDPAIDAGILELAEIEGAFRNAVLSGQIKAALQPIKNLETQSIEKYELLARWERSDGGRNLSPAEFIPVAERLGLLNKVLWGTLDQTLPLFRGEKHALAINISPSQLLSGQFFGKLERVLTEHDVPPEQIELEITEQIALRNDRENLALLRRACDKGFSIVLDDFGTGYSSISLLDQLPLSKVKIDHSFVKSAMESEQGKKLLAAIVGLLKQMNLRCCVEGVSSQDIEDFVVSLGCQEIQGYFIGKPKILEPTSRLSSIWVS